MKIIQLEDGPFLPTTCRIKKVIELEEDVPTVTMSITGERERQDVKQKQSLKISTKTQKSRCKDNQLQTRSFK